jgi:ATP-dependent DNA helicase RecQ
LLNVNGIGERKAAEYGAELLVTIGNYCRDADLPQDVFNDSGAAKAATPRSAGESNSHSTISSGSAAKHHALKLLLQGQSIDSVAQTVGRAQSTVTQYLIELIGNEQISDPSAWLDATTFERIRLKVSELGSTPLKPLFEAFNGEIPYDQLRIALACLHHAPPETQTAGSGSV